MCGSSDNRTCCGPSLAAMEKVSILHNWHPSAGVCGMGETCEVTMGQWGKLFHEAVMEHQLNMVMKCPSCRKPFEYWKVETVEDIFALKHQAAPGWGYVRIIAVSHGVNAGFSPR